MDAELRHVEPEIGSLLNRQREIAASFARTLGMKQILSYPLPEAGELSPSDPEACSVAFSNLPPIPC